MLKVLIADDSGTARKLLGHIINTAPDMRVVGEARNGHEAVAMASKLRPDVILMDVTMPEMDGLEATREIMYQTPTPIVVVSASIEGRETEVAFQAMRLGALTVQRKPVGPGDMRYADEATALQNLVRAMAGVRVITHRNRDRERQPAEQPAEAPEQGVQPRVQPEIVAIGSSTGGPAALSEIFRNLPGDFALPLVIVQHIAPDFLPSLVEWLNGLSPLPVKIAEPGGYPLPGCIYLAPGEVHLRLTGDRRFAVARVPVTRHIPSANVLLESVAVAYGPAAVGIILTGMGDDGATGLRRMYDAGAFTIAQDETTSAVYGMPREAHRLGAVRRVLPLPQIAGAVIQLATTKEH